jgi:hypothetical protein
MDIIALPAAVDAADLSPITEATGVDLVVLIGRDRLLDTLILGTDPGATEGITILLDITIPLASSITGGRLLLMEDRLIRGAAAPGAELARAAGDVAGDVAGEWVNSTTYIGE